MTMMSCNKLWERQQNTMKRRTGIVTVNRNCLSQSQHTALLSTPRGYAWTGPHGLSFIMKKCQKKGGPAANGRRREIGKHSLFDVNTTMWPHFVKQFLQSAEYSLAPATRIILTKILPSRVNFSDPKWSSYKSTQTELCRFLSNLNPDCDSINWKGDFFKTLSSLLFNYMVQVLCSGRISKKQKMTQVILKKINDVTNEYVILNSPGNFLQGVQIFVANMLSPWLEKPINNICNKGANNKNSKNRNITNDIDNQKIGIKTKHSKTNEVIRNKKNRLSKITTKKVKLNQKSKISKFSKKPVNGNLSSQNFDKATKTIRTNEKSKKGLKSKSKIAAVDGSEKIIENNEILSSSILVRRPGSKNTTKNKIKNNKESNQLKSDNNQKFRKSTISKPFIKGSLSSLISNKATKKIRTNEKSKKGSKSKSVIGALQDNSEKIIENNKILSNSILVRRPGSKNTTKKKIKNNKKSNHPKSRNNLKSKKSKISKSIVKGSMSSLNSNKATKTINTNEKSKKGSKSKSVIGALQDNSEKIIENNGILSNSTLVNRPGSKNASKTKIKSEKESNIYEGKNLNNTNGRDEYTNGVNGDDGPTTGNEKSSKSTKQLQNDIFEGKNLSTTNGRDEYTNGVNGDDEPTTGNEKFSKSTKQLQNNKTFEAHSNGNKKHNLINDDVESLRTATDAENTHAMIDTTHGGRNRDGQRIATVDDRSKSRYDGDGKLLLSKHGGEPTATDRHHNNANEDDGVLNVTDYSGHSVNVAKHLQGEKYDINLLKSEELLRYYDKTSVEIEDDCYSDVNTDSEFAFDNDDEHHVIVINEDGEEFESYVFDDLVNVLLDNSSAGWSNKHNNDSIATKQRRDESKRNYFQRCADGYAPRLLADNFRNKASTSPKVCDQSTAINYKICKKDGSNYSVRKTILPQCKNSDHQCTMCPLDKSKLVVNPLLKLKY